MTLKGFVPFKVFFFGHFGISIEGIYTLIVHPIQTIQGIVYVATHHMDVALGIWNAVSESWNLTS